MYLFHLFVYLFRGEGALLISHTWSLPDDIGKINFLWFGKSDLLLIIWLGIFVLLLMEFYQEITRMIPNTRS